MVDAGDHQVGHAPLVYKHVYAHLGAVAGGAVQSEHPNHAQLALRLDVFYMPQVQRPVHGKRGGFGALGVFWRKHGDIAVAAEKVCKMHQPDGRNRIVVDNKNLPHHNIPNNSQFLPQR